MDKVAKFASVIVNYSDQYWLQSPKHFGYIFQKIIFLYLQSQVVIQVLYSLYFSHHFEQTCSFDWLATSITFQVDSFLSQISYIFKSITEIGTTL